MKKLLSLVLSIVLTSLSCLSVSAAQSESISVEKEFSNASINLIDLDNWLESGDYENSTISKELDKKNYSNSFMTDVINIASNNLKEEDSDYILQLVDNGATLIIQNKTNVSSSEEICDLVGIPRQDISISVENSDMWINIGYAIQNSGGEYKIEPIFATVMQPKDNETFDIKAELQNFKNSNDAYVDPIDFYCLSEESKQTLYDKTYEPLISNGMLQLRISEAKESFGGYGYLYGKNGDAEWGITSGYTQFAYVEFSTYIVPEFNKGSYKYDAVECLFTLTGRNDKYIDSYIAFNEIKSNTSMELYTYLNKQSKQIFTTEYTWTTDGPESSFSVSTEVNPAEQTIKTAKTLNKVAWTCSPNSKLKNQSWVLEAGCLTKTLSGKKAALIVGLDELVVDNWLLKYTSPGRLIMNVSFQR